MAACLAGIPFAVQLALVAVLLVVDAGLVIGVFVPSGAALAAVAAQASDEPSLIAMTVATAALASIAGACFGYWRALSGSRLTLVRNGHARLARIGARIARCPSAAAAVGQCFAGARTLTPRLAARAGVPLSRVLVGAAPAALLWACGITMGGALLGTAATVLRSIGPGLLLLLGAVLVCWKLVNRNDLVCGRERNDRWQRRHATGRSAEPVQAWLG